VSTQKKQNLTAVDKDELAISDTQPISRVDAETALEEPPAPNDVPERGFEDEHTRELVVDPMTRTQAGPANPIAGMPIYNIAHSVRTHTGLVRDHNEDDYQVLEDHGVYLVADGMGGHAAGKVASKICVDTCEKYFMELIGPSDSGTSGLSSSAAELESSLRSANRAIFDASNTDPALAGMGTTAVGLRIRGDMVAICHAGDSRCYLVRHGRLRQVTVDHSLSNFLLAMGRETEARLAEATMSNVIMRALGLEPDVVIDTQEFQLRAGDRLMLCSDGLSDLVSQVRIERLLTDPALDRETLAETLLQAALEAGGRDNITVLVVDVVDRIDGNDEEYAVEETRTTVRLEDTFDQTSPGFLRP
jgi:serine/threonine protein phosphatase PrpC